jgi:subtilisin family serine protease
MDAVFDAQFRIMKDDFARRGIQIDVAYKPNGDVDYVYEVGRLLTINRLGNLTRLPGLLRGLRPADDSLDRPENGLVVLTSDDLERGTLTVPEALDIIDRGRGNSKDPADRSAVKGDAVDQALASPNHVVHIARICPADEPEVPSGYPTGPWPPQADSCEKPVRDVFLAVSDTGLLDPLDPSQYPWLAGVTGELDPLGAAGTSGLPRIPAFTGHGTFVAGVARCMAPNAAVFVNNHFATSGGELESVMVAKLEELAQKSPDIINLSAGTYTRNNWTALGFDTFNLRYPKITLVAAAGNDSTDRPFYPAAYDWAVAVGALATDQQHLAWFSNYGDWVDLYAIGEGLVNAFATGEYTYQEPPKMPAVQNFAGMAKWDGTSFSAPLVAGLIAARMARTGESSDLAAAAVIAAAQAQVLAGVGPMLYFTDQP